MQRQAGTVDMFSATPKAGLGTTKADLTLSADLSGGMMSYDWAINGQPYPNNRPLTISQGQRATLTFTNRTMMWHPMHLHGHTFQIIRPDGSLGAERQHIVCLWNGQRRASCGQSRHLDVALP